MQIILTEEEYNTLKSQADKADYHMAEYRRIAQLLNSLQSKYDQLLVHGVVQNNESLKAINARNY